MDFIKEGLACLKSVLGEPEKEIVLHQPEMTGKEWEYVKACIDTGWVSSVGKYVDLLEKKLADFTGIPHVVAVVNGTAALHIALILADVRLGDEVLVPALTFIATANTVVYCNAIPHFIDSDIFNLGVDIEKLRTYLEKNTTIENKACINKITGRRIKAIIPVHIFGHPVDMIALNQLCEAFCITVIEDAAESLGSYYHDVHTGCMSEIAVVSFNGNKIMTTGGGGALFLRDPEKAKRARHLTTTAKRAHRWEFYHDEVGYNYRLPNLNAAMGCAQLEQLSRFIEEKRNLAQKYQLAFSDYRWGTLLKEPDFARSNYWLNALILKQSDRAMVTAFIEKAHSAKYHLRGLWAPLDSLPMYRTSPKMDLKNTYDLFNRVIALPSSAYLGRKHA